MWNKIKIGIGVAFVAILSFLYILLQNSERQRDKLEGAIEKQKRNNESLKQQSQKSNDVNKAMNEQRTENEKVKKNDVSKEERRKGDFGTFNDRTDGM